MLALAVKVSYKLSQRKVIVVAVIFLLVIRMVMTLVYGKLDEGANIKLLTKIWEFH